MSWRKSSGYWQVCHLPRPGAYGYTRANMDYPIQVLLVRLLKFSSVFAFAASVGVGLWGATAVVRKRAVHLYASPALVAVWLSGYVLTLQTRVPLAEAWILGGFFTSLIAQLVLTNAAGSEPPSRRKRMATVLLLAAALVFMVARPTWSGVLP